MDPKDSALYWFILGVALLLLELLMPGLVVVFLGVAALLVALLLYMGFVSTWTGALVAFFILAIVLVLTLRRIFARFASSDSKTASLDEDADAFGMVVDILNASEGDENRGRIMFRGTTWEAESFDGPLKEGGKARLLKRENLVWIVEPVSGE